MRKLAPARVSYRDDCLISYRVYMMTVHFTSRLFKGTLHVDKIHLRFKIANIMHAPLVPVHRQKDFTPKQVVASRLHDAAAKFPTGVKFPLYATTGVISHRGDSRRHDILCLHSVNTEI